MIENSSLWVVSDVDGTLMDHSYDLTPAKETIKTLQKLSIPVILCTSKTAAEVKVIRKDLNLTDPYIVENGAAIYGDSLKNVNGEDTRIIGKRLKEIEKEHLTQKKPEKSISWNPQVGDFVKIKSLNSTGQIVDLDKKGGFYEIKCGSFRSTLSVNDFEGINGEKPNFKRSKIEIKSTREDFSFSKIRTSKNTIDVRGLRVHEAEIIIEEKIRKFHGPLWIVHGIGTGKLKKGLRNWLSGLNYVDKIEDAANNEGGPGCSIAWIK